jgi:hypothetical protein
MPPEARAVPRMRCGTWLAATLEGAGRLPEVDGRRRQRGVDALRRSKTCGAPASQGATILRGRSALPRSGNPYHGERSTDQSKFHFVGDVDRLK